MGDYDTTIRHLADRRPADFAWLVLGKEPACVERLPRALPRQATEADIVLRVDDASGRRFVLHCEAERRPRPDIQGRLLEYNVLLHRKTKMPVLSVLLLLEGPGAGREWATYAYGVEAVETETVRYLVIRLQGLDVRDLDDPRHPLLLALSPLVSGGTEEGVLRRAVEALRQAPLERDEKADALTAMAVFGTVHGTREMLYSLVRREEMKDSLVYQDILAEGLAEGLAKGRSTDILRVLRRRFGTLPKAVQTRVAGTRDPEALDRMLDLALDATSAEDFLARA